MRKTSLLISLLFLTIGVFAQQYQLKETLVTPPQFKGIENVNYDENTSMFNQFVNNNIHNNMFQNGVVVVQFTINKDGSVSNINLLNSVSDATNKAVIDCVEKSSGLWTPGKVDGKPVAMEKEIHVNFTDPSAPSLEDMAIQSLELGLKNYQLAMYLKEKFSLTEEQAESKSTRKLNKAIKYLETANKYQPQEASIVFWQACIYEQAGDEIKSAEKMNRFNDLSNINYMASTEIIKISIK